MILTEISDASIFISLFRYFSRYYSLLQQKLNYIYRHSRTCKLEKGLWTSIIICFRYSFLGRITETKQTTSGILDNGRVVQYFIHFFKRWKEKLIQHLRDSSTFDLAKSTKQHTYFSPVRMASMIVIIAITTNIVLSFVLQKPIGLWGWLMRGLFLSVAVSGLFCKADWRIVKKSSIFLRKMRID